MVETRVYTVKEFSEICKISESMVRKLIREGRVKVVSFGDRKLIPAWVVDDLLSKAC